MNVQIANAVEALINLVNDRKEIDEMIIAGLQEILATNAGEEAAGLAGEVAVAAQVPAPIAPVVTREEVRAVLAKKARAGKTDEVKALLKKHGATNLTGVAETELSELLKEGEAL